MTRQPVNPSGCSTEPHRKPERVGRRPSLSGFSSILLVSWAASETPRVMVLPPKICLRVVLEPESLTLCYKSNTPCHLLGKKTTSLLCPDSSPKSSITGFQSGFLTAQMKKLKPRELRSQESKEQDWDLNLGLDFKYSNLFTTLCQISFWMTYNSTRGLSGYVSQFSIVTVISFPKSKNYT